jgi:hypothetical protein
VQHVATDGYALAVLQVGDRNRNVDASDLGVVGDDRLL